MNSSIYNLSHTKKLFAGGEENTALYLNHSQIIEFKPITDTALAKR
jgi:hypothetical protein